ncbi:DUF1810 domain-containing protein [Hymenobacter metallilatus]|uniref:DUF1810 domain-containing protein n=1 Tax=Hymenobacter metallilatus TaxID=2493666 RepID=A0A428JK26_9BACT|nr:DUF1810 domain-containing protein [Hymenobacter metallilatus]RSK33100.1 DUF1810 domain-containing protein [Hymenobacter metallilatus]
MPQQPTLQRFLDAQRRDYATALAEIRGGRKRSHWIWYIFPQLQGLGYSETARFYAIQSQQEAEAYLQHPVLGSRLQEISAALLTLESTDATRIMGSPDDLKLRSSMTLFAALEGADPVFQRVLNRFFGGEPDEKTLQILRQHP